MRRSDALASVPERLFRRTEEELLGARADPLVRIAEELERLLAGLERLGRELESCTVPARERIRARYADLLGRAWRQRWYLVVQRESLGLRDHAILAELYPLPAPLHD